jgi:subtilisin family serine protease
MVNFVAHTSKNYQKMKKQLLLLFVLFLSTCFTFSQNKDPRQDQFNFVSGELIVKLKDDLDAGVTYVSAAQRKGSNANSRNSIREDISKLLGLKLEVKAQEALFSKEAVAQSLVLKQERARNPKVFKRGGSSNTTNKTIDEVRSLKNIIKLQFEDQGANILEVVEDLKDNPNVDYAEPNYNYSINDFEIVSDILYDKDLKAEAGANTTTPNDPLYNQQSNITQTNIDQVWNDYTTGDGSQIVAILDTGVDYTHPDLEANIWINEAELNGVVGYDDDGNGYVDDIRGWDFINNDNAPLDDNMHGTHVAGIVGAVGNNGIGVAGAAWNVKLMPIKVFQSNGQGNATTIAEGINYATENGATIQNMSFGSYAESATLKTALENAYASSFLIAAAGNNKVAIGPCPGCYPFYPAAYTFVLGVEDGNGEYDNYDQDGPIFSAYGNLLNYEVMAPGTTILNTVPNGGYRALTGTSMATPLVAGAMALYMKQKPEDSKELIFGTLINTSGTNVDIKAAIDVMPTPMLKVLGADINDEINEQNNNGFWEPGETLELFPIIKNYWGPTEDVRVGVEFWEFEDTSKAEIIEDEIAIGSISAYANLQNLDQSLKIKLADNIANNVNIQFKVSVWSGENKEHLTFHKIIINVKNAVLLHGVISQDLTLYADKEYLVSDNIVLTQNATLKIEPGVTLKISEDKKITLFENSRIEAIGTKDSLISFIAESNSWNGFNFESYNDSHLGFCVIKSIGSNSPFGNGGGNHIYGDNLLFLDNSTSSMIMSGSSSFLSKTNFYYNRSAVISNPDGLNGKNLNFINNRSSLGIRYWSNDKPNFNEVNIFDNRISFSFSNNGTTKPLKLYLGTKDESKYRREVQDALGDYVEWIGLMNQDSISKIPYSENHGIVWKVLVNGKDAQDEYDLMDPVGVGAHEFKVYFNREMDTTVAPQISYGVREPYNQKIITEAGTWSADGKIYTVNHDVNIGAADGINSIRVQDARDLDYFEIPVEDYRFNMLVQSAGSASTGFMATPGLGEIALDWNAPPAKDIDDVLGYNMYRYTAISDSTFTDPVKINQNLITNVNYKDYNVARDTQYFYKYKILRTSFEETDFSNTVSSELLTAALGDSNGDSAVNVMDVVNTVDHILGNNPTPFVDYATDVNNDTNINVLDVVGIVDMILNPSTSATRLNGEQINYISNTPVGEAVLFWRDHALYVTTDQPISGFQFSFDGDLDFTPSDLLEGYELNNFIIEDQRVFMAYSFDGFQIPTGTHKLLTATEKPLDLIAGAVATTYGEGLFVTYNDKALSTVEAPLQSNTLEVLSVSPNPSTGIINLHYYLPETMDELSVGVYDLNARLIWQSTAFKNSKGHARSRIDLEALAKGPYILSISANNGGATKFNHTAKIILK